MIDPRLNEYLEKKKYYIKNKITPAFPLEVEYAITANDIRKLKRYLQNEPARPPISLPQETKQYPVYPPNIQYETPLHFDKMEDNGGYEKIKHDPHFDGIINYVDDNKLQPVFLSRMINQKKSNRVYDDAAYPNVCVNKIREQYHSGKEMDKEILADLQLGMPTHTKKSYGFDQDFGHTFQFIDEDIQDPNHVVLPFARGGISCRLENRKQVKRDILQ